MGSSYFYLEFLLAWITLLKTSGGFCNPAIFALEYTLVPDEGYPIQLQQAIAGYEYVLSITKDAAKICVGGDSAGGTLILSLLLHLAQGTRSKRELPTANGMSTNAPGMAVLISPWVTLISAQDKNTPGDYLDADNLHLYAWQYAGSKTCIDDPLISPGNCKDGEWWKRASPSKGFFISYGSDEVFAPEIRDFVEVLDKSGTRVQAEEERGGIHAWPVAALFLSSTRKERQKGLMMIVGQMRERMQC